MKIKIIDVKVHVIKSSLEIPFAFSQGWVIKGKRPVLKSKKKKG